MNLTERKALVADLERHGFRTVRCTGDMDGDGVYNETFERPNGDPSEIADRITIEWGKREVARGLDLDAQRCPYVSNDPYWTDSAYGKREDGLRCGRDAGHPNEHQLWSSDGERLLPNAGWTLPR